jgi:intermembrane space import and assembly protein 40
MQDCFRQYPEIYGAEIADEEDGEAPAPAADAALAKDGSESLAISASSSEQPEAVAESVKPATPAVEAVQEDSQEAKGERVVPEKAHDATEANKGKEQ